MEQIRGGGHCVTPLTSPGDQTLITTTFRNYPAETCIDYDRRFRQLAAKNKTLAWDKYKEDVFVWCFSPKSSNANAGILLTHIIPFASASQESSRDWAQPLTQSHTFLQEQKFVCVSTQPGVALKVALVNSSTCATEKGVKGSTKLVSAPPNTSPIKRIITPLRRLQFKAELRSHANPAWVQELKLTTVSRLVTMDRDASASHITWYQHLSTHISKEIVAQRIAGPFDTPPLLNLQCSGVGVVPKKTGGWRMIMHLSAPAETSINDGINKEEFTLHYSTIDDAIRMINNLGRNALLAKIDIKHAFRTVPVRLEDRELLGIYWKQKYYIDCCLPCGLRSAPFTFNQYTEALEWILHNNYQIPDTIHYLDDFLMAGKPSSPDCEQALGRMLEVCRRLGFPIAQGKVEGPTRAIIFLGILLDTESMELRLPQDKLEALLSLLNSWNKKKMRTTKRELLSLIGKLSFAAKVVPAGRLFLRRLIDLSTSVQKLHHHITLSASARADIKRWKDFLPRWNGISLMLQTNWTTAADPRL